MKTRTTFNTISPLEYRRRFFCKFLTEAMVKLQEEILSNGKELTPRQRYDVRAFTEAYLKDELQLDRRSIGQIRQRLSEAGDFIQKVEDTGEKIAEDRKIEAEKEGFILPDEQPELNQEEMKVMGQLFDIRKPDPEISTIRDATVQALVAEDQKSQEIKKAIEIAQEQETDRPGTMEETVNRLNAIGPTSLFNGIINYFSTQAVKAVSESTGMGPVGDTLKDNKEIIKDRAVIMYSIFETASVFGIHKYSDSEIKKLAHNFYMGKIKL